MECKIKRILIKKLWGVKDIATDFYPNVNIFIGSNGSSKTTFLNLLEAVLVCDIEIFRNIVNIAYGIPSYIDDIVHTQVANENVDVLNEFRYGVGNSKRMTTILNNSKAETLTNVSIISNSILNMSSKG